jgi:hypothetical protein
MQGFRWHRNAGANLSDSVPNLSQQ